jgi:DNA invertase Pin-like site-specific DNA recombinase
MPKGRTPVLTANDIPRVKDALKEGGSYQAAARNLGLSTKTIYRFLLRHKLKAVKKITKLVRDGAA